MDSQLFVGDNYTYIYVYYIIYMCIYIYIYITSCDNHSFCVKHFWKVPELFLIYAYGFTQQQLIGVTVCLYDFAVII